MSERGDALECDRLINDLSKAIVELDEMAEAMQHSNDRTGQSQTRALAYSTVASRLRLILDPQ